MKKVLRCVPILPMLFLICYIESNKGTTSYSILLLKIFILLVGYFISIYVLKKLEEFISEKKQYYFIGWISAGIVVASMLLNYNFLYPKRYVTNNIEIQALGQKNELSNGNEVWVTEIMNNGRNLDLSRIESHNWIYKSEDHCLVSLGDEENGIRLNKYKLNKNMQITFLKHAWSGKVMISVNGNEDVIDLYNENGDRYIYEIPAKLQNENLGWGIVYIFCFMIVMFYLVYVLGASAYLIMRKRNSSVSFDNEKKRLLLFGIQLLIYMVFYLWFGKEYFTKYTYTIVAAMLLFCSLQSDDKTKETHKISKCNYVEMILSILISVYTAFSLWGKCLFNDVNEVGLVDIVMMLLLSWTTLSSVRGLFIMIDSRHEAILSRKKIYTEKHRYILWGIIFLILVVESLAFYPVITTADGTDQWAQAIGKLPIYDAHTPTHTLLIRACSKLWKNPYCVVLVQIALFSCIFSKLLYMLLKKGISVKVIYIIAVLMAILPNNIVMLVLMSKNIALTIIYLWCVLIVWELVEDIGAFFRKPLNYIKFTIALTLLQLVRKNTFIAVYAVFVVFIILCIKHWRKVKWYPTIIIVSTFLCVKVVEGPVYKYFNVQGHVDVISGIEGPIASSINAVLCAGYELPDDVMEKMQKILPIEEWIARYDPYNRDIFSWTEPIPDFSTLTPNELIGMFFKVFKEHPIIMMKDRLDATDIIWNVVTPPYVYVGRYSYGVYMPEEWREMLANLVLEVESTDNNIFCKTRGVMAPIMQKYINGSTKIQLLDTLLWRMGLYFTISLLLFVYAILRKKYKTIVSLIIGFGIILSLLMALGWQIYQYVWFCFPACICILLYCCTEENEKNEVKRDETTNNNTCL